MNNDLFPPTMETALRQLFALNLPANYAWVGVSTTGLRDKLGDIIPSTIVRREIAATTKAIETRRKRDPQVFYNRDTRENIDETEINGNYYFDYGALLVEHNMRKVIGRRVIRIPVKEHFACLECGYTNSPGSPATMSIGYNLWTADGGGRGEVLGVYSYEVSKVLPGLEANQFTFYVAKPTDMRRDKLQHVIYDNFMDYAKGLIS